MTIIEIELMIVAALLGMLGVFVWQMDRKVSQILLIAKAAEEAEQQMANEAWNRKRRDAIADLSMRRVGLDELDYHDKPPGV